MSTKENKALARHWFAEGWNKGNVTVANGMFSPHFTLNGIEVGTEGPKMNVARTRKGFPNITFTVEDQVAEEDRVVTRFAHLFKEVIARSCQIDYSAVNMDWRKYIFQKMQRDMPGVLWEITRKKMVQ